MAWCDKIAIVWFGFLFLLAMVHGGMANAVGTVFDLTTWAVVLIPWATLRALDWIIGGPRRRAARSTRAVHVTDLHQDTDGNYTV